MQETVYFSTINYPSLWVQDIEEVLLQLKIHNFTLFVRWKTAHQTFLVSELTGQHDYHILLHLLVFTLFLYFLNVLHVLLLVHY